MRSGISRRKKSYARFAPSNSSRSCPRTGERDLRLPVFFFRLCAAVQRALEGFPRTPAQVATGDRIDAALAVRILRLANSAFLNPSAKPITELQQAVKRLAISWCAAKAVSFALSR